MISWKDLKVQTKLSVLVMTACLALMIVGTMGLVAMRNGNQSLEDSNRSIQHVALLEAMKSDFLAMRLDLVYMMALSDPAKLKDKWDDFSKKTAAVRQSLKKAEDLGFD